MTPSDKIAKINWGVALLASANFLSAFAGGAILRQQEGIKQALQGADLDVVLYGLLLGYVLGIVVIKLLTWKRLSDVFGLGVLVNVSVSSRAAFTSFCCALTSAGLLFAILNAGTTSRWIFGSLLAVRFAFWYATRSFRSEAAAGHNQRLAWVDLLFYLGMILGLFWTQTEYTPVKLLMVVLGYDIALQLLGAAFDYFSGRMLTVTEVESAWKDEPLESSTFHFGQYLQLTAAIVALTVGTQIMLLEFGRLIKDGFQFHMTLASTYGGGAIAAFLYGLVTVKLGWNEGGHGVVSVGARTRFFRFDFLAAVSVGIAILAVVMNMPGMQAPQLFRNLLLVLLLAASIFVYEILALCIFDYLGKKVKKAGKAGFVALTLALMGLGGASHYYLFRRLALAPPKAYYWLILTSILAVIVAAVAVRAAGDSQFRAAAKQSDPKSPKVLGAT